MSEKETQYIWGLLVTAASIVLKRDKYTFL